MRFFLGTHEVRWLGEAGVPLFISRTRLAGRRTLPRAIAPWALDSGGFTALDTRGCWDLTPDEYLEQIERYAREVGLLEWAAPMDFMCEPRVRERTGLSIREHQERTIENYLALRDRAVVPIVPVLQGWELEDYLACLDLYADAGVSLAEQPLVGLGTVCRRQATGEIARVVSALRGAGLQLHGFGVKAGGLRRCAHLLSSADSMAWSSRGRFEWQHDRRQLCDGTGGHAGSCANCMVSALRWRERRLAEAGLFAVHED